MTDEVQWYDDETFWDTSSSFLFCEERLQNASPEVDSLIAMLGITPESSLLDLCCGTGRHALEFGRRGYKVTGVDRTEKYLEAARSVARDEDLDIEFIQDDIRRFVRPNTFDCVINLFTSFGYFDDPDDDRRVVENVYESLKTGGTFLIETKGKEIVARDYQERDWLERGDLILLEERKITRNWSWIENRWIVLKGDVRREFRISLRLYSAVELIGLLTDCGFSRTRVFGELSGESYDPDSSRLVVVGYK